MPTSDYITLAAVIVALLVALRDSYYRARERKQIADCFLAYYRPASELLLKRTTCMLGELNKHKKIRLGASRPHQLFKLMSLLAHKGTWLSSDSALQHIHSLPPAKAKSIALALGEFPMLLSDLETLEVTNEPIIINERDQDLILSIIERLEKITKEIRSSLALSEEELERLVENYQETLYDGTERFVIKGTNRK